MSGRIGILDWIIVDVGVPVQALGILGIGYNGVRTEPPVKISLPLPCQAPIFVSHEHVPPLLAKPLVFRVVESLHDTLSSTISISTLLTSTSTAQRARTLVRLTLLSLAWYSSAKLTLRYLRFQRHGSRAVQAYLRG